MTVEIEDHETTGEQNRKAFAKRFGAEMEKLIHDREEANKAIMDVLVFDPEEIKEAVELEQRNQRADTRICVCGHNARSHASQALPGSSGYKVYQSRGTESCTPGRMQCPCKGFRPVVETSNVRLFVFKTTGAYAQHALTKGIASAIEKGYIVMPIGKWECDACHRDDADKVGPVPFDDFRQEISRPSEHTLLLCANCVRTLRAGNLFA